MSDLLDPALLEMSFTHVIRTRAYICRLNHRWVSLFVRQTTPIEDPFKSGYRHGTSEGGFRGFTENHRSERAKNAGHYLRKPKEPPDQRRNYLHPRSRNVGG